MTSPEEEPARCGHCSRNIRCRQLRAGRQARHLAGHSGGFSIAVRQQAKRSGWPCLRRLCTGSQLPAAVAPPGVDLARLGQCKGVAGARCHPGQKRVEQQLDLGRRLRGARGWPDAELALPVVAPAPQLPVGRERDAVAVSSSELCDANPSQLRNRGWVINVWASSGGMADLRKGSRGTIRRSL